MFLDNKDTNLREDIKLMSYSQLNALSEEIREFLIDKVSKTGGHLASNLGAVELTIALHRVFDTSKDKLIFDVGHQSYVHKIITGRANEFDSLRQMNGISGFPKRSESIHDAFDSGHSSTSISAAFGYAKARDLKGENYCCVAVIGDGALTGGVAYEALDVAGDTKTPLIVILNDNQMSIDGSKGGMHSHLHRLRTSAGYQNFKTGLKKIVEDKPGLYKTLKNTRDIIKNAIIPAGIFEELGFKYFGPIDGHDIKAMTETFRLAKSLNRPVIVHVLTKKGKGFKAAEQNPAKFHGIGSFDPKTIGVEDKYDDKSYSEIFGRKLVELANKDNRICAISAAMLNATGLSHMQKAFPDRVFDAGIAEQHAVSFAAGLALNGMKPVVAIYSTFLQRAYDQIVSEVALQNLPVIFAIDRAGITGRDGETHQGMFDIAYMNSIPNMTILVPKDGDELKKMLEYAFTLNGPVAIRYPRESNVAIVAKNAELSSNSIVNNAELLTNDGEFAIIACGSMVKEALNANVKNTAVYNIRQIKPIQKEFFDNLKKYKKIITIEDGCLSGGMGESLASYMSQFSDAPLVKSLAWPDKYIEHGSISELREKYGLDSKSICKTCEAFFEE